MKKIYKDSSIPNVFYIDNQLQETWIWQWMHNTMGINAMTVEGSLFYWCDVFYPNPLWIQELLQGCCNSVNNL